MSALADIFAAVRLQLDGTGFEAQATALADKSGKNVGTRMSQQLNATLKKAAGGAIGAGLGLAFSAAANGALELNAATAEFTAQTGASDAAAKEFTATLATLNKTNVQSIPEIGEALAGLQLHFKLAGDAAKALGGQFLDFSRVAGGTAVESVNRFDELVDAGVITVDQMAVTMDKLVASHQKFGVNINDTIAALVKFAPAMSAAGISTDDAIGLMNMFSESGLNAEAATKAFNIALGKVKSPEELQRLVGQIAATEDPFKRAQLAADLFGKRAGVQLANALKPGSGGLAAWVVKAEEVIGKTTEAGDALDSSFGNQAKLKLKEFSGTLAEMGTSMGDLLMVFALLGPGLTRGLLAGFGGLAGLLIPKIVGALSGIAAGIIPTGVIAGTEVGTAMGAAAGAAEVTTEGAGVIAGQAVVAAEAAPAAAAAGTTLGGILGAAAAAALPLALAALPVIVLTVAYKVVGPNVMPKLGPDYSDYFNNVDLSIPQKIVTQAEADAANAGKAVVKAGATGAEFQATVSGIALGAQSVQSFADSILKTAKAVLPVAAEDVVATFGLSLAGVIAAAKRTGADGMLALAQGITAARAKPLDAFDTLKEMLKHALTATAEAARLGGELTSKALRDGLHSKDPAVRAQAEATKQLIIDRLTELAVAGGAGGKKAMAELRDGLHSKDPDIRKASKAAYEAAMSKIKLLKADAGAAGAAAGLALATGLLNTVTPALNWAMSELRRILGLVGATPPKPKPKPGGGAVRPGASGLAHVAAYEPIIVGEDRPELFVPDVPGRLLPSVPAASGGVGGTTNNYITVPVTGLVRARDPLEIATQLRRLASFGVLTPKVRLSND